MLGWLSLVVGGPMKVWWLTVGCQWMVNDCRAVGHSVMLGIGGWLVEVGVWGLVIG